MVSLKLHPVDYSPGLRLTSHPQLPSLLILVPLTPSQLPKIKSIPFPQAAKSTVSMKMARKAYLLGHTISPNAAPLLINRIGKED